MPARQFPQSAFSASGWVNAGSGAGTPFAAYDGTANSYFQTFTGSNGSWTARIIQTTDTIYVARSAPALSIPASTWAQFGLSWNGGTTDASVKTYNVGVQTDTANAGAGTFTAVNSANCASFIGAQKFGGSFNNPFPGLIADVAFWNVALTAAEFAALGVGARPYTIRPLALVGYWPVTGIQSPEPDFSGLNNNGTVTGTVNASGPPFMFFTPRWPQRETPIPPVAIPELQNFNAFVGRKVAVIGY